MHTYFFLSLSSFFFPLRYLVIGKKFQSGFCEVKQSKEKNAFQAETGNYLTRDLKGTTQQDRFGLNGNAMIYNQHTYAVGPWYRPGQRNQTSLYNDYNKYYVPRNLRIPDWLRNLQRLGSDCAELPAQSDCAGSSARSEPRRILGTLKRLLHKTRHDKTAYLSFCETSGLGAHPSLCGAKFQYVVRAICGFPSKPEGHSDSIRMLSMARLIIIIFPVKNMQSTANPCGALSVCASVDFFEKT